MKIKDIKKYKTKINKNNKKCINLRLTYSNNILMNLIKTIIIHNNTTNKIKNKLIKLNKNHKQPKFNLIINITKI